MITRIEDLMDKAKEENKYNSAKFLIKNRFDESKFLECKMLDAYYEIFSIDGQNGFIRAKEIYKMFGGKDAFYFQFELEYLG